MKIISGEIKEDSLRDCYWKRVHFKSDDESQKTTLLICASEEYIFSLFNTTEPEEIKIKQWFEKIVENWKSRKDEIFNKEVYYDPYANTPEGIENILTFLKTIL